MKREDASEKIEQMERKPERELIIRFNADKSASMQWDFRPQQSSIKVRLENKGYNLVLQLDNRPFLSFFYLFQNKSFCKTVHMRMCLTFRFIFIQRESYRGILVMRD